MPRGLLKRVSGFLDLESSQDNGLTNHLLTKVEHENPLISPFKELAHAADQGFFGTSVESGHEDDTLRAVAALIYWVRH